ncbi:hypothetical protein [Natrinema sp. DC36]|uniref:hypothetical protein n=1 Tax=Natrinema sp. DC36 TaxID=2878680 RepID=UPI001CEFE241|nr:hypothetical protein [Natrinema sp. DC36]
MKSGTTDPFANDDEDEQTAESDSTDSQTDESDSPEQSDSQMDRTDENQSPSGGNTRQFDRSDLPRILGREKVKDDRDDVHQLFVYEDTDELEKQSRRDLEDRFDDDIYKLDAREAIYRAGMENLDDAEKILREWGADF